MKKAKIPRRRRPESPAEKLELWELRLYVAGETPKSLSAFANLTRICKDRLKGRYVIEVIDITKRTRRTNGDQILAVPTLVRKLPHPVRKIIGDLSDTQRVLIGLDLQTCEKTQ